MRKFANWKREGNGSPALASLGLRRILCLRRSCDGLGSFAREQGDINVLEDLPRRDAKNAVGRFDEVVALAAGVLTAEHVGEGEAGCELFGFDQKTSAVSDPWT